MPFSRRQTLALAAGTAGLLAPRWAAASDEGTLRLRAEAPLSTFDPAFARGVADEEIYGPIYSKLIQYRPGREWDWQLDAAALIEQVDARHIRFSLKGQHGFTDGFGELTTADVKASLERIVDPQLASPNRSDLGTLSHVEVIDDREGVIVLTAPFAPIWTVALPYITGNILSKKALESIDPSRFTAEPMPSSGPYRVDRHRPGGKTVLIRNTDWSGWPRDFERIEILPMGDPAEAEAAFLQGRLDFTEIPIDAVSRYEGDVPRQGAVETYPTLDYIWLGMNVDHPNLSNRTVRRAIQHAIDVPAILDAAFAGTAEPATGIVAPGVLGHRRESLVPPGADLLMAQKLLDEEGVADLTLTLDVLDDRTLVAAAEVVQTTLAALGIALELRIHPTERFWSLGVEAQGDSWRDVQLLMNRFSMRQDPHYATAWFTQSQVGIWNWERFRSEDFDALHNAGYQEVDPGRRRAFYEKAQELMERSGAYRFLTHGARPVVFAGQVKPALRPDGRPLLRYFAKA